jgi:XapX domain-containing protein
MLKFMISIVLGFGIGLFCRAADLPSPGPPFFQGAFLVCTMTLGFLVTDILLKRKQGAS